MNMASYWWFITAGILLIGDVLSAVDQQNNTVTSRHCFSCDTSDAATSCDTPVLCPDDKPFCATVATSPGFMSSLQCTEAAEETCAVLYTPADRTYRTTCICASETCNRPFSHLFALEFEEFSTHEMFNVTNTTDVTDLFLSNSLPYANISKNDFYIKIFEKTVTINTINNNMSVKNTVKRYNLIVLPTEGMGNVSKHEEAPRAEALKQEVISAPTDDEEDEGEGSGSWGEEGRPPRRPATAAAPSSHLPAHQNKGSSLFINLLVTTPFMLYVII